MTENFNPYCKYNAKGSTDISDEQMKEMFPGISSAACTNIMGKQAMSGNYDQITYDNQIQSYINEVGYPLKYYPYLFIESKSEEIYSEHSAAEYGKPFDVIMILEIQDKPSWMSNLGMDNDETVTAWIHIKTFYNKVKEIVENENDVRQRDYSKIYNPYAASQRDHLRKIQPKPKDLFQLTTFACDREWERGNRIWEITNVEDEIFSEKFNMSMGHYIWKITAKRYRYSYETGMSIFDDKSKDSYLLGEAGEIGNHEVYESKSCVAMFMEAAGLSMEDQSDINDEIGLDLITEDDIKTKTIIYEKVYNYDIKEDSKKIFDMEKRVDGFYNNDIESNGFF